MLRTSCLFCLIFLPSLPDCDWAENLTINILLSCWVRSSPPLRENMFLVQTWMEDEVGFRQNTSQCLCWEWGIYGTARRSLWLGYLALSTWNQIRSELTLDKARVVLHLVSRHPQPATDVLLNIQYWMCWDNSLKPPSRPCSANWDWNIDQDQPSVCQRTGK